MPKLKIDKGTKYGKLTVIKEGVRIKLPSGQYNRTITCKCDCGSVKDIRVVHLTRGRTKSCGCLLTLSGKKTHGKSHTDIYTVWRGVKNRVKPYHSERHLYYDKGIEINEEWKNDFEIFEEWSLKNGYKKGLQIDRIDNSKGYYPDNCRYVTPSVNVNNRDNTVFVNYKGQKMALMDAIRKGNRFESRDNIRSRISRGWDVDKAIDTPTKVGNYKKKN
jgi:hypothetical protein